LDAWDLHETIVDVEDECLSWKVAAVAVAKYVAVLGLTTAHGLISSAEARAREGPPHPSPVSASTSPRLDVGGVRVPDIEAEDKIDKKQVS
jgi:hypothetical protein